MRLTSHGTAGGQFALAIDPVRCQGLDAGADHGVMTMPGGERYEGEVNAAGEPHGQGVMVAADGQRHEGAYRGGLAHGWGVLTWPSGERYAGEFRDGEAHGHGVMTWPEPICGRFEGEWVEGRARWTPIR